MLVRRGTTRRALRPLIHERLRFHPVPTRCLRFNDSGREPALFRDGLGDLPLPDQNMHEGSPSFTKPCGGTPHPAVLLCGTVIVAVCCVVFPEASVASSVTVYRRSPGPFRSERRHMPFSPRVKDAFPPGSLLTTLKILT